MKLGRRLAFDFGLVRVGVAVSDENGILATPLNFLENSENLKDELVNLLDEYLPIYIAVGIPKHLSGADGQMAQATKDFIKNLGNLTAIPIYGIDERFSSKRAIGALREGGKDSRESKGLIDSAAAAAILNDAMDLERKNELEKCKI